MSTDVAAELAKMPEFNPNLHPAIIFRGILMGLSQATIAEMIGLTEAQLGEWVKAYPELQEQANRAVNADAEVLASVFYAATGWNHQTASPLKNGPDMRAAALWLKHRLGWNDKAAKDEKEPSSADVLDELRQLERKLSRLPPAPEDGKVVDVKPHVDPGF